MRLPEEVTIEIKSKSYTGRCLLDERGNVVVHYGDNTKQARVGNMSAIALTRILLRELVTEDITPDQCLAGAVNSLPQTLCRVPQNVWLV